MAVMEQTIKHGTDGGDIAEPREIESGLARFRSSVRAAEMAPLAADPTPGNHGNMAAFTEAVPVSRPMVSVTLTGFLIPIRFAFTASAAKA
jgi:hypothetical protein